MIGALVLAAALAWTPHPSDGVTMTLARDGAETRLDFDFHGHAGYAIARARIDRDLPPNYEIVFDVRGDAQPQNLELKLLDETGDNVWWLNRRDFHFPRTPTTLHTPKRKIAFAWGPRGGGELAHVTSLELVVTAGSGGKGTVWFTDPEIVALPPTPTEPLHVDGNAIDFGATRELGGLVIDWRGPPTRDPHLRIDGVETSAMHAGRMVWLPDARAQRIAIDGDVAGFTVEPPSWAPSANDFWSHVAHDAKRGDYPRYLIGEQSYWTVIGAEDADEEALVSEDGAIEPFKGGGALEPFLVLPDGQRLTWADVTITQSLADGYLPIPSVTWTKDDVTLTITAAVSSTSMLELRYEVRGDAKLVIEPRPFQVNPSTQFLNLEGGFTTNVPSPVILSREATNPSRGAAVILSREDGEGSPSNKRKANVYTGNIPLKPTAKFEPLETIAAHWHSVLDTTAIDIPADPRIANTIRTSVAYMLIERDGAAFKPGSRSYDRAWIRDGALIASTLLRLGHDREAKSFATWYAPFQYADGKVPCCVDARGADPVPENDSHGEFILLVADIWRYTHDAQFVATLWPHVAAAAHYIDQLRAANHGTFEGLVTESISHEGYSAKPMHSYWDDFFALRGLDDAAMLAGVLHRDDEQRALAASAQTMRRDLAASIRRTIDAHHIDYVPGSAELGDFDATSTAIGISPLNLASLLPASELQHTFDRYLASLRQPRDDYTPYETRNIGALIRLGRRDDATPLIDFYLHDRRPLAWHGWAEVVRTDPRKAGFIGDMPHAWVASDFVRSMLDAFAYEAEDGSLVVAAGVPRAWLAKPLHVGPLETSHGPIDVRMYLEEGRAIVEVDGAIEGWRIVTPPDVTLRARAPYLPRKRAAAGH